MSALVPECRSGDCSSAAEFSVESTPNDKRKVEWSGKFCKQHLMRVMEIRLSDAHKGDKLNIEKIGA